MIFVDDNIPDGNYLLTIQIPAFVSDAAPSDQLYSILMNYKKTAEFASQLDKEDQLSSYRDEFYIPKMKMEMNSFILREFFRPSAEEEQAYLNQELEDWARLGVEGHEHAKNPWMPYHELLSESYSKIVGGKKVKSLQ